VIVNIPAIVVLWGTVITAMFFCGPLCPQAAKRSAAPMGTGSTRPKGVVAARIARIEMDDDEFHRRLM